MFEAGIYKSIKPYGKERVVKIIRPSIWSHFWLVVGAIFFILGPFFFLYPLFTLGRNGLIIFGLALLLGLILLIRFFVVHYLTALVLTTSRLVDIERRGLFFRSVTEVLYDRIQNISFKSRGFFNSVLGLGDIYVDLINTGGARAKTRLKLAFLKNPEDICGEIAFWQRRFSNYGNRQEEKAIHLLEKIKRKIGEKAFIKLIQD